MPTSDLLIQQPEEAAQLIVLLHDKDARPEQMQPLGESLAHTFPYALVVAPMAPEATQGSDVGLAWFESDAPPGQRESHDMDQALHQLGERMLSWQKHAGVTRAETALLGFGQGASLALQSTLLVTPWADRVLAIGGAFTQRPTSTNYLGSIHLLHGKNDEITHWKAVLEDAYFLRGCGVDMTEEILPMVGHELHPSVIDKALERLSTHISRHLFEGAMAQAPGHGESQIQ